MEQTSSCQEYNMNIPSKGWLIAHYRKYFNKWATFQIVNDDPVIDFFKEANHLTDTDPVFCKAVFSGFMKLPPQRGHRVTPKETELFLCFRKMVLIQNEKEIILRRKTRIMLPYTSIKFTPSKIATSLNLAGLE